MGIHTAKIQCPLQPCERVFTRLDKLRLHWIQGHSDDQEATCPVSTCAQRMSWIVLRLHIRNHIWNASESLFFRTVNRSHGSIYHAFDKKLRICPISSCKHGDTTVSEMQNHLQEHNTKERMQYSSDILGAGYDPSSTNIVCPICREMLQTTAGFEHHMEDMHISTDGDHLRRLRYSLRYDGYEFAWRRQPLGEFCCRPSIPCCEDAYDPTHHIKLLRDYEDLRPFRIACLKLWPQFAYHPVFDDIIPVVKARGFRYIWYVFLFP